jgi:hypothetical protein
MEEIRASLLATKSQVRSLNRMCRTTLQVLNDLEQRIDDLLDREAQEGTATNGYIDYRITKNTTTA